MAERKQYKNLSIILLNLGSLLLLANAIFTLQLFSTQYGLGLGALVQSKIDVTSVAAQLSTLANQLSAAYQAVLESYLVVGMAIVLLMISLSLYLKRHESQLLKKRYTLMHLVLTLVYIMIFFIMHSTFNLTFYKIQIYLVYVGIALSVFVDAYVELDAYHIRIETKHRPKAEMNLNPQTPYTNMLKIRDELFSQLYGELRVVDKHFNSIAVSNLNRLISENPRIKSVVVITSREMLDSKFANNYNDLKAELKNKNIEFTVKIMNEQDAHDQHERFIFDEHSAFKVPPFNIINRKSEHILKLKLNDVRKRFSYLNFRSVKFENYGKKPQEDSDDQAS